MMLIKKGGFLKDFKISLAAARKNACMTQAEVAKILRKTPQTIVNWENGKSSIDVASFVFLCDLYNVPKDNIFLPHKSTLT